MLFCLYIGKVFSPSSPKDIIAAHAPATKPPGLLPAMVGDTYSPPDHSVTAS